MAFSLSNSTDRRIAGLDIDGRFLAGVVASPGRIEQAASTELPEGLIQDGEVLNAEALAAAIKDFVAGAGLPKRVRLGVSNQQIVVRVIELPPIEDREEREMAVRFQAAEAIAMPLDEAILDHQVAGASVAPDGSPRMRVVLVAARRAMVESVVEAVKAAGLKPDGIDLDAFALVRMLAEDHEAEDAARVFCHLGGVTNLAIAVGSSCLFTRPLSVGVEAEDSAGKLADDIRLSIDYYMAQPEAKPVGEVVLSGPGSQDEELVETLGGLLSIPVTVAEPLRGLDAAVVSPTEDPRRYTVAAGLALGTAA
jgi:type IV pilus assembly protein PilM